MKENTPYPDRKILNQIAEGNEDAFASLYALYAPRLKAYAWKFTKSTEDAEEMLQESFLQIWLNRERLADIEHLQAWIYKITARCCLQWLRKRGNDESRLALLTESNTVIPTPSDIFKWRELEKSVQEAIVRLPEKQQNIYRFNREEGLKPAAIALRLNMPVGTVKNNLRHAIRSIREHLVTSGYYIDPLLCLLLFFF